MESKIFNGGHITKSSPVLSTTIFGSDRKRAGDVWCLGRHRLICGDARDQAVFDRLMGDERADLMFTDPPYNLPLNGHVTGLGRIRHREFVVREEL